MERLRLYTELHRCREKLDPRDQLVENVRSAEVGIRGPALHSRNRAAVVSSFPEASLQITGAKKGSSYALPPVMEQRLRSRKMERRLCRLGDEEEAKYHVVDDQEETNPIQILPPKPLTSDEAYADRCTFRSSCPESPASASKRSPNTPPRLPKRNTQGPSINRSLKPGMRQNSEASGERKDLVETGIQDIPPPRLPERVSKEPTPPSPALATPKARRGTHANRHSRTETGHHRTVSNSTPVTAVSRRETRPMRITFSQDLEFSDCRETRSLGNKIDSLPDIIIETATGNPRVRQQHHEWPPTRGDMKTYGHQAKTRPAQTSSDQSWYVGACERKDAEHALHLMNMDGAFLVRDHSKSCVEEPFVLSLLFQRRVFNIKIRFIKSSRKFALGTGLRTNDMFDSVDAIIKFHMIFPIVLINGKDQSVQRRCTLTCPLTKDEVNKLLSQ